MVAMQKVARAGLGDYNFEFSHYDSLKNSTQWVHESNASWIVSAVEIC